MGLGDLSRINTNTQAISAYNNLNRTNNELAQRQLRLSTGSRINAAEDDSAGYSIAKKLEARVRGQGQALSNIGDAKSMLSVAEGGLNSIMDIMQTMKEKAIQAANDTMGGDERTAIKNQLTELSKEVGKTISETKFNGTSLFSGAKKTFNFQVNAEKDDTFSVDIATTNLTSLHVGSASLDVSTSATTRKTAIGAIDDGIKAVAERLAALGDSQKRLSFKEKNLTTSMNNYEAARSRIADADFAKEQMQIVKLQILQQTGTASLAQANSAPQSVLSLIG